MRVCVCVCVRDTMSENDIGLKVPRHCTRVFCTNVTKPEKTQQTRIAIYFCWFVETTNARKLLGGNRHTHSRIANQIAANSVL